MKRFEFESRKSWSNIPGIDSKESGDKFPTKVKLPNGDIADVAVGKQHEGQTPTKNGYYQQEGGIKTKVVEWGDYPSKSYGARGKRLYLQVPSGSELIFE